MAGERWRNTNSLEEYMIKKAKMQYVKDQIVRWLEEGDHYRSEFLISTLFTGRTHCQGMEIIVDRKPGQSMLGEEN